MGYTTQFEGAITIDPPLDEATVHRLQAEADSYDRRVVQLSDRRSISGYCQWVVNDAGTQLAWDGNEKFYDSPEWMRYLIETEVIPTGRVANGTLMAQGEETGDVWQLIVENNQVFVQRFDFVRRTDQIALPRKQV